MFDYKKFEDELVIQMENTLKQLLEEYNDIYIFSLDISNDMASAGVIANTINNLEELTSPRDEDYYYYKYCEEEWDIWEDSNFGSIGNNMRQYLEMDHDYYEHQEKIIESSKNALIRFNNFKNSTCPDLMLTLNVREFLDGEERIEIFEKINSKEAIAEYSEHIDDFV